MVVVVSVVAIAAPVIPAAAQAAGFVQNIGALTLQTPGGLILTMSAWELLIVGTDIHNNNNTTDAAADYGVTYDCWKPVLRDTSIDPSNGKIMKELMEDERIQKVIVKQGQDENRPDIRLVNIWGEEFDIEYVTLSNTGHLAMHAVPIASDSA